VEGAGGRSEYVDGLSVGFWTGMPEASWCVLSAVGDDGGVGLPLNVGMDPEGAVTGSIAGPEQAREDHLIVSASSEHQISDSLMTY